MEWKRRFPRNRLFTHQFISPLISLMNSREERHRRYRNGLKLGLILSLALHLALFQVFPKKMMMGSKSIEVTAKEMILERVPLTEQMAHPPPPPLPVVPIPSENPEIPEDLTLEPTELDFMELLPEPPPLSEDEEYVFIAYDQPPRPVGGYSALLQYLEYPEMARRAGVEGTVIIGVLIDVEGNSVKTVILKSSGGKQGFDEAAQQALMKMKWIPARQREKPIQVWISVPVVFRLN